MGSEAGGSTFDYTIPLYSIWNCGKQCETRGTSWCAVCVCVSAGVQRKSARSLHHAPHPHTYRKSSNLQQTMTLFFGSRFPLLRLVTDSASPLVQQSVVFRWLLFGCSSSQCVACGAFRWVFVCVLDVSIVVGLVILPRHCANMKRIQCAPAHKAARHHSALGLW